MALAIDVNVSTDQIASSGTVTSPSFTTASTNELLLAFVGCDGGTSTVNTPTGAGLTWVLVAKLNSATGQNGPIYIFRAFSSGILTSQTVTATSSGTNDDMTLNVVSLSGVDTSGTNGSGAIGATQTYSSGGGNPTGTLTTTRNNAWVFAGGNDWDTNRTVSAGTSQTIIHQNPAGGGAVSIWSQRQNATTPTSGTVVTMNATTNALDRYNWVLVEVLPVGVAALTITIADDGNSVKAGPMVV